jgi:hypothetical protein
MKELNIRPKTLKLVQERAGNTMEVIGIGRTSSIEPINSATKRKDGQMGLH